MLTMIDTPALTQLLLNGLSGKITWLAASDEFPLDELIDAFHRTRAMMIKTVADLTDEQASYQIEGDPTWSISEMVTHLIYSQNFYYNQLLDITTSELPHILEAAKGLGQGAKLGVPAPQLTANLQAATVIIYDGIERTRSHNDPTKIATNPIFGRCNYQTWILLLLGHEMEHVRQGIAMRHAAKRTLPSAAAMQSGVGLKPEPVSKTSTTKIAKKPKAKTPKAAKSSKTARKPRPASKKRKVTSA